ncbi:hypothetical protein KP509_37G035700 [Ceratopteris richardii]|uniref:Protein kinase domain-containing protein n=1 Tax=Ceratopteris richardii TaxID=49495 RepID=A0A8T2Q7R2_CERRI|nr:hypothetical protein KP509_37G035700 [Ceratopteris richardii]
MASSIKRWQQHALLGAGSFGRVSLAINLDNGSYFAVKSIQCGASASEEAALEVELSILQSLHSPRILKCMGAGFSSGAGGTQRHLFLEYMEGGSVAQVIKQSGGFLDEARARSFTRAIVEGLAYLHEQGLVHCDIKGENILVGSLGVKIADFGAAKKQSADSSGNGFKGTPLWMAPEVVRGDAQTCESDIWSLGCTVVEMLQGRPPWDSRASCCVTSSMSHVAEALFKIGYSSEQPPVPQTASAECQNFLRRTLERDPKLRWTATELLEHPWLQAVRGGDGYEGQLSPRSTMDFPASDCEADESYGSPDSSCPPSPYPHRSIFMLSSELSDEASCSVMPDHDYETPKAFGIDNDEAMEGTAQDLLISDDHLHWITVRSGNEYVQHKPFMRQPVALRRKAEDVNFDSLAFLRSVRTRGRDH